MLPPAQARSSSTLPTILRGHQINPSKPPSTYRLLYLNTNGLSSSRPYNKTATIITTAHQFDPDAILIYPLLLLALILPGWQEVCANGLALVRSTAWLTHLRTSWDVSSFRLF
mmetsp:Transcript_26688/g.41425  ORF Transcript_26688/g.41425 Transcript_26688/m.41425 type:complete len:113 (-) Transcript_26688:1178-1516(-)